MSLIDTILESSTCYAIWSAFFNAEKIKAIKLSLPDLKAKKVLDLGCGPATNTKIFLEADYTGIDINPRYIEKAKGAYPQFQFFTQSILALELKGQKYDVILMNSIIHHLSDFEVTKLFTDLKSYLKPGGTIILSEPLLPTPKDGFKYYMMRLDRGRHFRTYEGYCSLFDKYFLIQEKREYNLKVCGLILTVARMLVLRLTQK